MLEAEVTPQGDVLVEGQNVGQLHGFRFTPDPSAAGEAARALNAAALKALAGEIEARAERFSNAVDESVALANDGTIRWLGEPIAKLAAGDKLLAPRARLLADEHLTGPALETVQRRLDLWLTQHVRKLLGPVLDLEASDGVEGIARGIAYQAAEALGVLERSRVAEEMKTLDQTARGVLRKLGLRFGAYHIYLPQSLKPAPRALAAQLWALRQGTAPMKGLDEVPYLAASGRTSFPADPAVPKGLYRAAGFKVCGERAVRVDILERLADLIRPAIAYRPGTTPGASPAGAADNNGFVVTVGMTSLAGCSGEDFSSILRSLGYVLDRRPGPAITVPLLPAAPTEPLKPAVADTPEPDAPASGDETPADVAETLATPQEGETPRAFGGTEEEASPEHPIDASPVTDRTEEASPETEPAPGPPMLAEDEAAVSDDVAASEPVEKTVAHAPADGPPVEPPAADLAVDAAVAPSTTATVDGSTEESPAEVTPADGEAAIEAEAPALAAAEAAEAEPAEAQPAEPVLIEVWRPHRTNHHAERRPERPRHRPARPAQAAERPHGRAGQADAPVLEGTTVAVGEGAAEPEGPSPNPARPERSARPDRDNRDRPREHRPGGGARPGHGGPRREDRPRPAGEGRPASVPAEMGRSRPDADPRRDRPPQRDRPDKGRGAPFASTEPHAPRERQPDPDSPFAKLLALKAELEGRSKKE